MITNVTGTAGSTATSATANSSAFKMATEDFLELLLTELENQDPMDPVSTSEMASQFASLTQVSQQDQTNKYLETLRNNQAVDYLGKTISYVAQTDDEGSMAEKTSQVTGVVYKDGVPSLVTKEGEKIALDAVTGVS